MIARAVRDAAESIANIPPLPDSIEGYEILGLLGAGGMGIVYRAQQHNPTRVVALKVLSPSSMTRERIRRFRNEAEYLGRLRHPGIAQIHDAGIAVTPAGRCPYLTMELVEGARSITRFAQDQQLDTRARLSLLADVCDAVEHAHQKGLIHRDLKPDNVVVDCTGRPRILDFGVARDWMSCAQRSSPPTDDGSVIGTLPYMSPEQASGTIADMDTRSDIYTLGVLTYKLLTGRTPYESAGTSAAEAIRVICDREPTRIASVRRDLRGDVDTIVSKALEKDPDRRYQSAAALRDDIRRYLDDLPLLARPPSTTYHLLKYAKRNKPMVAGAAAVCVMLALGVAGTAWQAAAARREADAGLGLLRMFLGSQSRIDPLWAESPQNTAMLDDLSSSAGNLLRDDLQLEANLRDAFGFVYLQIGNPGRSETEYERLLELNLQLHGPSASPTLRAYDVLVDALLAGDRLERAEEVLEEALHAAGHDRVSVVDATAEPASYAQALRILRLRHKLAKTLMGLGRFEESERVYRQTLSSIVRILLQTPFEPSDHQNVAELRHDLAKLMLARAWVDTQGSIASDEPADLMRSVVQYERTANYLGVSHLRAQLDLIRTLVAVGQLSEAQTVHAECEHLLTNASPEVRQALSGDLARTHAEILLPTSAEPLLREALHEALAVRPDHWRTALLRARYAQCLALLGRQTEAVKELYLAHSTLHARFGGQDVRAQKVASVLKSLEAR